MDGLVGYVNENKRIAIEYIKENIPELATYSTEATYLLWIDISGLGMDSRSFTDRVYGLTGLRLAAGANYGSCGDGFVRMNLATQRARVLDGLDRLSRGIRAML